MKYSRKRLRRTGAALIGGLLLAGLIALHQPSSVAQTVSNDEAFRRISNRLQCQCGCGYMVLSCNMVDCNSATYLRKTIQSSLSAGKSEDAIVASFIEQYGPKILNEPPTTGFSLAAWVMPFAALLIGGTLVGYILWQWKLRSHSATVSGPSEIPATEHAARPPSSNPELDKYKAEIERELENED